ncbi:hypothetical protein Glove_482g58 [Diversispora epigaea]|uniref:TLDc domain-containing protein n=1 Tax=Diversispora epigaea TaxID=1348612 RepID=A0A397GJI9_9GLOM|nr:hypothetical protein Glove_482g58 [Diversispora epigaea]
MPTLKSKFSAIINEDHVAELSSWIDRKSTIYSLSFVPYEFQLILRGSRDAKTFWNMCHGCAGTIVVVKVAGTDEIIGGYNPLTWDNLKILRRVINSDGALFYHNSNKQNINGPYFGACEFMMKSEVSDFTQDKQCWCSIALVKYEKPIRTTSKRFSIYDYEVFKIIKKQIPNR